MRAVCILAIYLSFACGESLPSFLTDKDNKTSTLLENKKLDCYEISFLRQMINQETVIRLALVKNVHALVNDVTLLKQSLATSETKISEQQQTVVSLQKENRELKNSSRKNEARIMELERKLETVNENVSLLSEHLYIIRKDSEEKRQEMFNKTNSVLDDIKIEVRYLSVTLLDFKEHTEIENELRDEKSGELERYFNSSYENLRDEIFQTKSDYSNHKTVIQNLEESQTEIRKNFTDKIDTHAFSAGIASRNSSWTGDILVFPDVIYSEGTGYNPSTGIFTAPTAGTYVFYVSIQSELQMEIRLDIVMNGSTKTRAMAYYNSGSSVKIHQTGTNLVILHLQTGDKVWIRRYWGSGYFSDFGYVTTFSGFKIH